MQVGQGFTVFLFIYLLVDRISESTVLQTDSCPRVGRLHRGWYEPGCTKCNCVKNGFECFSCGSSHLFTSTGCYIQEKQPHALYPLCCENELICKGDPKYDATAYTISKMHAH